MKHIKYFCVYSYRAILFRYIRNISTVPMLFSILVYIHKYFFHRDIYTNAWREIRIKIILNVKKSQF